MSFPLNKRKDLLGMFLKRCGRCGLANHGLLLAPKQYGFVATLSCANFVAAWGAELLFRELCFFYHPSIFFSNFDLFCQRVDTIFDWKQQRHPFHTILTYSLAYSLCNILHLFLTLA